MTKEQMQAALNQATAEAAELKAKIADLETRNGRITAELAEAKKQIEATAGANAILEDELKEARAQQQQPPGKEGQTIPPAAHRRRTYSKRIQFRSW